MFCGGLPYGGAGDFCASAGLGRYRETPQVMHSNSDQMRREGRVSEETPIRWRFSELPYGLNSEMRECTYRMEPRNL